MGQLCKGLHHPHRPDPAARSCRQNHLDCLPPRLRNPGKEDGKPYTRWIADLASKYKIRLVWVNSADQAIRALNSSPRFHGDKVESFYYFGHSNCYAWMLDYGNNIMAVSTEWIHETDLNRIRRDIFHAAVRLLELRLLYGSQHVPLVETHRRRPLWGNTESTRYGPVSDGRLPEGAGKWVK